MYKEIYWNKIDNLKDQLTNIIILFHTYITILLYRLIDLFNYPLQYSSSYQ